MRIGIDSFGCDHGRSGVGAYLQSMVRHLPKIDNIQYEIFGSEIDRYTYDAEDEHIPYVSCTVPDSLTMEKLWHFSRLNRFAKKQKYDVIIIPAGSRMLPFTKRIPVVAVVQDVLSPFSLFSSSFLDFFLLKALQKSTCIIASSQYIKKTLVNLKVNPNKISVVHNGIDHSLFYPHTELDSETVDIKPFAIKRPYFIYASRLQNLQKKHIELINAFSIFKKRTGLPHRLVLAGSDGPAADLIHKAAASSSYASEIFLTGYFPHESLPEFYSCAEACIFPSVVEGVGLPIIEAMATGIPVACAKSGALTEIAGNNTIYFDADDPEEIATAMETIVTDKTLREKLVEGGFEWTKRFSWERTTDKTIEIIKALKKYPEL